MKSYTVCPVAASVKSIFLQTGIFLKGIEHLNWQIYSKQICNCLLVSINLYYDVNKMLWFNNMSQCLILGGVWQRESCPSCRLTCSYITQVIFVQRSVLCCPVVLLFSVLAVHRGNCSTSSRRAPLHTSLCPNPGFLFPPPVCHVSSWTCSLYAKPLILFLEHMYTLLIKSVST